MPSLYRPTSAYKSTLGPKSPGETAVTTRDLKGQVANLEAELERREGRCTNLTTELTTLRAAYANMQREHRIVSGTFERLNTEREKLTSDLTKCRDHILKLETQLTRLSDSQQLLDHLGRQQEHIDGLQTSVERQKEELAERDEAIKALKRDVDSLHRTLDIQMRFDGHGDDAADAPGSGNKAANGHRSGAASTSHLNTSAAGNNTSAFVQVEREKMRSLYYELGKRQADAHSLALTLADNTAEADELQQSLRHALSAKFQVEVELIASKEECAKTEEARRALAEELTQAEARHAASRDMNARLTGQVEDLSRRLSELRGTSDAAVKDKESVAYELSTMLYTSQMEVVALKGRVQELEQAAERLQSGVSLTEQRAALAVDRLTRERDALEQLLHQAEALKPKVQALEAQVTERETAKEQMLRQWRDADDAARREVNREKARADEAAQVLDDMRVQLRAAEERERALGRERADGMGTLERTIDAAKSLTAKLAAEKERRVAAEERAAAAERLADGLQRAKEHVSAAVLDALHQEKTKNARLEKTLMELSGGVGGAATAAAGSAAASSSSSSGAGARAPEASAYLPAPQPAPARTYAAAPSPSPPPSYRAYTYPQPEPPRATGSPTHALYPSSNAAPVAAPSSASPPARAPRPSPAQHQPYSHAPAPASAPSSSSSSSSYGPAAHAHLHVSTGRAPPPPPPPPFTHAPSTAPPPPPPGHLPASDPVMAGLARLREHLREIEEQAPSLMMDQSATTHTWMGLEDISDNAWDRDRDRARDRERDRARESAGYSHGHTDAYYPAPPAAATAAAAASARAPPTPPQSLSPGAAVARPIIGASTAILLGLPPMLSPPSSATATPTRVPVDERRTPPQSQPQPQPQPHPQPTHETYQRAFPATATAAVSGAGEVRIDESISLFDLARS